MSADPRERSGQTRGRSRLLPWTLLAFFGIFIVGWWLAVVGISRDMQLPVDERWVGSGMLFLEGAIALLWTAIAYSWQRAAQFALVVLPSAFLIELVGVTVGLPFGPYHYTDALAPRVVGRVPAPITFAWLMIALGTLATATWIIGIGGGNGTKRRIVPLAALLAVGLDACLEPTAYHVKAYWLWEASGRYYGVPTLNFAGWLIAAIAINALAARVLWRGTPPHLPTLAFVPIMLYWATVAMFAIIDGFRGYPAGTAIGVALCLMALPPLLRMRRSHHHRLLDTPDLSTPSHRAHATAPNSPE